MAFEGQTTVFETPSPKAFQYSGSADGSVGQDVNQFQGSVTFSVPVVALTGRSGLGLEISAVYSSNVASQVGRSNLDAPTGILGLGWDLLLDCIEAEYAAPGNRDSATFFVTSRGARNQLHIADRPWKRAELPSTMAATLDQGRLDADLVDALLAQTLAVDLSSDVTVCEPGVRWIINDSANEFVLHVQLRPADTSLLDVFDGGTGYEMESFEFSRVRYYADYSRWEVYSSSGLCSVFGGGAHRRPDGNYESRGNAIVWGVRWNNWEGPSSVAQNPLGSQLQTQYPRVWMLSSQRAVNRDEVTYAYEQVTQRVGAAGLLYTKAIYLSVITDMFDRTATLAYGDKRFSTDPGQPREYLDPYKSVPDSVPDAYQSRYETRYLQSVVVRTREQDVLSTSTFAYSLALYCPVPGNAPPGYGGDRYKRVLISIEKVNGHGFGLPSMTFSYHDLRAINPGALASKTLPEGALVLYSYQQKSLSACSRSLSITPAIASATPRIWFGPDYAVVMWLAADRFSVTAYTWSGRWITWQPSAREYPFSGNVEEITAALDDSFFVIGIRAANQTNSAFVYFHKDNRVLGGWVEPPALPLLLPTIDYQLATGGRFFAISNGHDNSISRYVWSAASRTWQVTAAAIPPQANDATRYPIFLAASANLLGTLFYDRYGVPGQKQSIQQLDYVDEAGAWQTGSTRTASELFVTGATLADIRRNLHWTASSWVCVATAATQDNNSSLNYQINLYTWGHSGSPYQWDTPSQPFPQGCSMAKSSSGQLPYAVASQIFSTGMVTSGPYLLRFNGQDWLPNQNLRLQLPVSDETVFWFAEGPDIVLKTENSADEILGQAQVYDPNLGAWSASPITLYDSPPETPRLSSYFPTASGDFISFNRSFYYRGSSTNWVEPTQRPIPCLPPGANATTLINEAPGFMVYLQENEGDPTQTEVLLLDSGCVGATETLQQSFFRVIEPDGRTVDNPDGQLPAGAGSFATFLPLNAPFSQAQSITLHRYLNGSIINPVTDFPVLSVTVDDGYRRKTYSYDFDAATAAVNPQGYSYKYYHSRVQVGDGTLCGRTEFTFINGVGGQLPGNPTESAVLDGQLALKQLVDSQGQAVASQRNQWSAVYTATDPQNGQTLALQGAFVQLLQAVNTADGVSTTQAFGYDPGSGQLVTTSTQVLNGVGQTETHTKWVTPAYADYPELTYTNQLAQQAGSGYTVGAAGSPPVTSAQQSVSMRRYPGPSTGSGSGALQLLLPWKSFARQQPGQGSPTSAPQQWLQQSEVLHCNPSGEPTEITNPAGLVTSSLFAAERSPLVATFAGASLSAQEAYYFGFEPYESPGVWSLDPAVTPVVSTISCTGTRSLCIPPGAEGAPLVLTPADRGEAFLFGFWGTLDPAAGNPEAVAAWRIEFQSAGPTPLPDPIVLSVSSTDWAYTCARIDLSAFSSPVTLRITPQNAGTCNVYLDNVCFSRLQGAARVKVYDPVNFLLVAEVGPYNQIRRHVYDFEQREIATSSEAQAVISIVAPFLSRQDSAAFDAAAPNSQLVLQPMGATWYERFRNNGVWDSHFASDVPADWQSQLGQLNYLGDAGGSIRFTNPQLTSDYAVRFDVANQGNPLPSLGVGVGDALQVRWHADQSCWTLTDAANSTRLTHGSSDPRGAWTLVLGTEALIFAVNGNVLFDYVPAQMPVGQPCILAEGPLAISNFVASSRPQIAMKYFDGASKTVQGQSVEGRQTVVSMPVYDTAARPVVQVKPVAYSAATGTSGAVLGLRNDLVTGFDWSTGVLTGKAAQDYPADEGYPYVRQRLETSPLERLLESGAPGKTFAITGGPSDHTARQAYGSNQVAAINAALGLQAGRYSSTTHTDQDGHVTVSIKDNIGRPVASATLLDDSTSSWLFNLEFTEYSPAGVQRTVRVPNFYAPPQDSDPQAWVNVTQRDLLGLRVDTTTPDAGLLRRIADCTGKNRFTQNPVAGALGLILYAKYDDYGRVLEGGVVPGTWDPANLAQLANQPHWPSAADGARPVRQYRYGDDPAKVNDLGRLVSTLNFDELNSAPTTSNARSYDEAGQVTSYALTVAQDESRYAVAYTYDNLGNVASTVYASGYTVYSERDEVGRVSRLRDGTGQVLGSYTYNADDQTRSQVLLPGSAGQVNIGYAYAPPGWLQQIDSSCMAETLGYTTGGYGGEACYSGRLASASTVFRNFAQPPGDFPPQLDYAYAYDARGQLSVAQAKSGGQPLMDWSLGLGLPTEYDPNGNFLRVQDGAVEQSFVYKKNTNQVLNTTGGEQTDYETDAAGAVTRSVPAGIERIDYQLVTRQARAIETVSHGAIALTYDSSSNRVRKTTQDYRLTYIRGVNGWPLSERLQRDGQPTRELEYIYGPRGICAIRAGGVIYTVLTDHLNSVRGIAGADGKLLAAFHYNAFGDVVVQYGDAGVLRYRFTGYEYDEETGLYNAAARLYDPRLKRFYSVDPQMQFYSPYIYGGNNPISVIDPTGEAAWWAVLVGAVVGVLVTVATGGALAPVVAGLEGAAAVAASAGVAATAGALGSLTGDATTAGLAGEKFTATRALIDIAGGAAGGAAGAVGGGAAAQLAMKGALALSPGIGAKAVTAIGHVAAGVVGGTAGAVAQSTVTAALTGQSFFSVGTALNIAVGGAAGFGGALLGSGAHMGWSGDTMPVPVGRNELPGLQTVSRTSNDGANSFITFNPAEIGHYHDGIYQLNPTAGARYDVIDIHGSPGVVYPSFQDGAGNWYLRPMSTKLFAEHMATRPGWASTALAPIATPVKLSICQSAKGGLFTNSAGRSLATALGRTVQGGKGTVYMSTGAPDNDWVPFA